MKQHITLVGKETLPIFYAIKEYGPDNVFFIQTTDTAETTKKIIPALPESIKPHIYNVGPYSPSEVRDVCNKIHELHDGEFSYNLTGGTKPMAFAAFTVAMTNNALAMYTSQDNEIIRLDDYSKVKMDSTLDNLEILKLSGNDVSSFDCLKQLDPERIKSAKAIKRFIEQNDKIYQKVQKLLPLKTHNNDISTLLPKRREFSDGSLFEKLETGGFRVSDSLDKSILLCNSDQDYDLLFQGRWWEVVVASKLNEWKGDSGREIWQNVEFSLIADTDKSRAKNEIDILINDNTKLIFIECKSGNINQTDIYKINAVRDTYGGEMSKAVLVSYYPVRPDILEKCNESQIHVFAPRYTGHKTSHIDNLPETLERIIIDRNI